MSRKAFSFYRSHYEQMKLLDPTQVSDIIMAICKVQFLEENIEDISFTDKMTQLVWTGIKHGVDASVKGYVNKKGDIDLPLARGLARGSENVSTPLEQGEEKEKEKEEEKGEGEGKEENFTKPEIPLSQRQRVGQRIVKRYKNFMEMKEHLAANHNKYKDLSIEFEGEKWGIGRNGIPWSRKNVDDMPFEQRKLFWLHLISYQHLLEG